MQGYMESEECEARGWPAPASAEAMRREREDVVHWKEEPAEWLAGNRCAVKGGTEYQVQASRAWAAEKTRKWFMEKRTKASAGLAHWTWDEAASWNGNAEAHKVLRSNCMLQKLCKNQRQQRFHWRRTEIDLETEVGQTRQLRLCSESSG